MTSFSKEYQPTLIEQAAQRAWQDKQAYQVREPRDTDHAKPSKKFYACSMLPYPSGKLHMGHVRNYTINDMLTRYLRMNGHNVLMPMGWDAFGLPAENAAMKNKVPPAAWTYDNIATMKKQMQAMGLAIDWDREIATCSPDYYKWNQWLFLRMLEKGIAYKKTQIVNWDPVDQTVLANEQVIDGRGWRSGAPVEKREIPGYYLAITQYAEELLSAVSNPEDKNFLSGWPERVRLMQENWIGKSTGVRFAFPHQIQNAAGQRIQEGKLYVFTTRADTIMGVTFVAVAPEHPLAQHAAQQNVELATRIEALKQGGTTEAELALKEKEGVATGLHVQHPFTGAAIEVWVGNYVLMSYGDGAVMGVPAHDERDFAFAKKYGLAIQQVIAHPTEKFSLDQWQDWYGDKSVGMCIQSGKYDGLNYQQAVDAIAADLAAQGLGEKKVTWRLRDWGISRQRYWGTPIPIIHCDDCGDVPVPDDQLPVVLPEDCIPDGSGNPLNKRADFLNVPCPTCGKPARRETDTMDTFVDSSWYFLRYCNADNPTAMVDERANYWMPMDQYIGGIEHAILHLLYARFWTKAMRDLGLLNINEPFKKLLCQGMVLNHIYSRRTEKGGIEYFWPHEVEHDYDAGGKVIGARLKTDGSPITYEGVGTMSKSKNNGVDPQELIDRYGADTARLYTMFTAPPEATLEWNEAAVDGSFRFLKRVWQFASKQSETLQPALQPSAPFSTAGTALRHEIHSILKQITFDFERMQYNTVVSGCMKLLNALESFKAEGEVQASALLTEGFSILLRVLYPATPHITHALWESLGYAQTYGDLLDAPWPQPDPTALELAEIELVVQVNGKVRGSIQVAKDADKATIEQAALANENVQKFVAGNPVKKIVVVPGKLVSVVV